MRLSGLAELLTSSTPRCGRCGRRLRAGYSGTHNMSSATDCRAGKGGPYCLSFGGLRADDEALKHITLLTDTA